MNTYFIKQIGNHHNNPCIQGFFTAPNESYLFEMIDQKCDPYGFIFAKVNGHAFGAYFTGFDYASHGHRVVDSDPITEDEIDIETIAETTEFEFDSDHSPSFDIEASELKWKTWTPLSLGRKTHFVDQFGEPK